jgi:methionine sulfoxide reductase heme-binding subunit
MTNAAWYAARGTGVVSLIMLSIVMVLGVGSRSGRPVFGLPRFAVNLVHRNASLIAVVLLAIHVGTLLIDPYAQLHLVDVVVPFAAPYRTVWVGFGTVALDLVVALVVTSLLRARIGQQAWRVLHWLAYAAWPVAWIHGIGAGTDRGSGWYLAIAALSATGVLAAVAWRCTSSFTTLRGRRSPRQIPDVLLRDEQAVTTTYRGGIR